MRLADFVENITQNLAIFDETADLFFDQRECLGCHVTLQKRACLTVRDFQTLVSCDERIWLSAERETAYVNLGPPNALSNFSPFDGLYDCDCVIASLASAMDAFENVLMVENGPRHGNSSPPQVDRSAPMSANEVISEHPTTGDCRVKKPGGLGCPYLYKLQTSV